MSELSLFEDWEEGIGRELEALKGYVALRRLAYRLEPYRETSWEEEVAMTILLEKLVEDLETRLRELDEQARKAALQTA